MGYTLSKQKLVKKTFGDDYTRKIWDGGEFGNLSSFRTRPHTGVDYAANAGERIHAIYHAEVTAVRDGVSDKSSSFGDNRDYGNFVMYYIEHADVTILDSHTKPVVKAGDIVAEGQYIGQIDRSGFSTAAHLHKGIAKGKFTELNAFNAAAFDFETYTLPEPTPAKTLDELVSEVARGVWGNGADRVNRLTAAGHDASTVQAAVNAKLNPVQVSSPVAEGSSEYINLKPLADQPRYGYYRLDDQPVSKNIRGYLLPYKLGGISYKIVRWSKADVAIVKTRDFGEVQLYVDPLRSTVSKTPTYKVYGV